MCGEWLGTHGVGRSCRCGLCGEGGGASGMGAWNARWLLHSLSLSFPRQRGVRNGRLVRPAFSFLMCVLSMTHELDVQKGEAGDMGGGVWTVFVLMRAFRLPLHLRFICTSPLCTYIRLRGWCFEGQEDNGSRVSAYMLSCLSLFRHPCSHVST